MLAFPHHGMSLSAALTKPRAGVTERRVLRSVTCLQSNTLTFCFFNFLVVASFFPQELKLIAVWDKSEATRMPSRGMEGVPLLLLSTRVTRQRLTREKTPRFCFGEGLGCCWWWPLEPAPRGSGEELWVRRCPHLGSRGGSGTEGRRRRRCGGSNLLDPGRCEVKTAR